MLERLRVRLTASLLCFDLLMTLFALWAAAQLRLRIDLGYDLKPVDVQVPWPLYPAVVLIWLGVSLVLAPQRAVFSAGLLEATGRLIGMVALGSASFAGLLYFSFRDVSRLQFLYFVLLDLVLLLIVHLLARIFSNRHHQPAWQRRVLIIGDPAIGRRLASEFDQRPWAGLRVVGYVSDETATAALLPYLGSTAMLPAIIADQRIDEAIFAMPPQQHERVAELSLALLNQPVMLHMLPGVLDLAFARTPVATIGGIPLISLRESALTPGQRILKRIFDLLASATLLLLLAPLLLLIAILIKLESPGSVFFVQERIGEHGRRFRVIKFRSMYADADQRWQEVVRENTHGQLVHKQSDDLRVTRVGRRLRRASLDELPQLINVLRGEMSLVGPRPELPYIAAHYEPWQWQRFRVPPGMTGWWQINGRSDRPMHLHTEDDLYYIQNYSFWLDLRILLKTPQVVWQGQGAF